MKEILETIIKYIKNNDERMIIGISGHGASGKTTFANNLMKSLNEENVNYVNTDPYIIGSSSLRKYTEIEYEYKNEKHTYKMSACHPGAHNISALERDINMIRSGFDLYSLDTHYAKSHLIAAQKKNKYYRGYECGIYRPRFIRL